MPILGSQASQISGHLETRQFVGAGYYGGIITSPNGTTWTVRTAPASRIYLSVVGSGSLYFILAGDSSGYGASSPTGVTWTERTLPSTGSWNSVIYGGGMFVAIKSDNPAQTTGASSPDGITWTSRTITNGGQGGQPYGGAYGGGVFSVGGNGYGGYSSDGISWSAASGITSQVFGIAYGNSVFAAAPGGGGTTWWSSSNGSSYTSRTGIASGYAGWYAICYGSVAGFMAFSYGMSKTARSTDAITWTEGSIPSSMTMTGCAFGAGKYITAERGSTQGYYSTNGTSWTSMTMPSGVDWNGFTYA